MSETEESQECPREASRVSMFLTASLSFAGAPVTTVRVRNLSAGGVMVECSAPRAVGTRVTSEIKGIGVIEGHVAWTSGGRMGIRFDTDIDPDAARMDRARPAPAETGYKPIVIPGRRPGLAIR